MFEEAYIKVLSTPKEIQIGPYVFDDIEAVDTDEGIKRGLMFRDDIPENFCMMFRFYDNKVRSFWMKNCRFPIIVVFADEMLHVTSVHKMDVEDTNDGADMKRYSSGSPAKFAFEFKDSILTDAVANIKIGDTVKILNV